MGELMIKFMGEREALSVTEYKLFIHFLVKMLTKMKFAAGDVLQNWFFSLLVLARDTHRLVYQARKMAVLACCQHH